jgi:catechol 2,3-dioxygenase-like lactoylglutathione lyase family enzyme
MADVRLFRVIVPVPEIEAAARFYGELLADAGERVSPERHYIHCGGTILALVEAGSHGGPAFRPNLEHIYFAVENIDQVYARARAMNATLDDSGGPFSGLAPRPWGETCFYLRDPFDNPLCFVDSKTLFTGSTSLAPGR